MIYKKDGKIYRTVVYSDIRAGVETLLYNPIVKEVTAYYKITKVLDEHIWYTFRNAGDDTGDDTGTWFHNEDDLAIFLGYNGGMIDLIEVKK